VLHAQHRLAQGRLVPREGAHGGAGAGADHAAGERAVAGGVAAGGQGQGGDGEEQRRGKGFAHAGISRKCPGDRWCAADAGHGAKQVIGVEVKLWGTPCHAAGNGRCAWANAKVRRASISEMVPPGVELHRVHGKYCSAGAK
jgi:hypothetical protein